MDESKQERFIIRACITSLPFFIHHGGGSAYTFNHIQNHAASLLRSETSNLVTTASFGSHYRWTANYTVSISLVKTPSQTSLHHLPVIMMSSSRVRMGYLCGCDGDDGNWWLANHLVVRELGSLLVPGRACFAQARHSLSIIC
jgi:hypothetical protein